MLHTVENIADVVKFEKGIWFFAVILAENLTQFALDW